MINFSQVWKRYPSGHEALKGVSFDVSAGEMIFLTGHSGAGKSTLLKLIAAITLPTSGSVIVDGQNIGKLRRRAIPQLRRKLGLLFQDQKLLHDRPVFDNVALPLQISGFPRADIGKRVRAALDKVGLLGKEKMLPITLSGGEQQRLCIARAVVSRPSILLADEPTANLDTEYAEALMSTLKSFNQVGVTVIVSTHDENLIKKFPAKIICLANGQLVHSTIEKSDAHVA